MNAKQRIQLDLFNLPEATDQAYFVAPLEDGWAIINNNGRVVISAIVDYDDAVVVATDLNQPPRKEP